MDMSVVEGEDKPVNVNELPEYAAEIHTYLREMEVRDLRRTKLLFLDLLQAALLCVDLCQVSNFMT